MGYKVNDEVLIKARIKDMSYVDTMYVCELVTEPNVCIRFKSPSECIVTDKTYADGLNDAWKLADKVYEMRNQQRYDVFGTESLAKVMDLSPQEALAKIKAYEKEKLIKVGDVVECPSENHEGIVTCLLEKEVYIIWSDGSCGQRRKADLKKTGRTAEGLTELLRQIGE